MLDSQLMKALILNCLKQDVWHVSSKTNFGTIDVNFGGEDTTNMTILVFSIEQELKNILEEKGYTVTVNQKESQTEISLNLGSHKKKDNYRAKEFKKFLRIVRRYEKTVISKE
ncbi:MAG: hypothetical protein ACRCXZ_00730 [Patescibacteria group bacterium]